MIIPYSFHPQLVLRSPKKNIETNITEDNLIERLYNDSEFLEALFLASPVLCNELNKYIDKKTTTKKDTIKLRLSLAKYYLRMSNRCTPFGLFSGCSVAHWSDSSSLIKINSKQFARNTRFDMHYLCALAEHLAAIPFIREELMYYPNSSWYEVGNEIRYVEYKYLNGKRHHSISAVMASEYVFTILKNAAGGIKIKEAVQLLVNDEIAVEEAMEFVNEIIASQLLVNGLAPAITGNDFLHQIIATLEKIPANKSTGLNDIITLLQTLQVLLRSLDDTINNDIAAYQQVIKSVKNLGVTFEDNKLFQTDISFSLLENKIETKWQQEIIDALNLVHKLSPTSENSNIKSFCKRFYERYEDTEVPLLQALDTESGIGYLENNKGNIMPLIDDITITGHVATDVQLAWSQRDQYLMKKLLDSIATTAYSIELKPDELDKFKNDWSLLPPSLAIAFRLLDDDQVFLENAGGSSAVNLLGRFAHGNSEIHQIIKDIVLAEEEQNSTIIFAEISHLPESRIGNVLMHPVFRKYEIPFLSKSSVTADCQILLQDLYISVKDNSVVLRSKKLNKQVIPRLSTAHNYAFKALPIYQFLCDLQLQGKQSGIYFDWGVLQGMYKFLPRVTFKNCIVHPATWNFEKPDIAELLGKEGEILSAALKVFKARWNLPTLIILADSDYELLINLENRLMTEIWLDAVKNRPAFMIKEFLAGVKNVPVQDENNKIHCNQFIAVLLKNIPSYGFSVSRERPGSTAVQEQFFIGTEWLYFKIYCGVKAADIILGGAVYSLVTMLVQQGIIDSFFFVRYSDPNFHLRLRFHIINVEDAWLVTRLFYNQLQPVEEQGYIHKIQPGIYKRELSRYGDTAISLTENLFFYDSMAVLDFLQYTEGDERERIRWLWAIRAIDDLLDNFDLTLKEKFLLLEQIKNSFHAEHSSDKFLKEQLNNKFRVYRTQIENILNPENDETGKMSDIIAILKARAIKIRPVVTLLKNLQHLGQLSIGIAELLPSYIHMLVNKIVVASPRIHELVIYDMLFTAYRSAIAREKKAISRISKDNAKC